VIVTYQGAVMGERSGRGHLKRWGSQGSSAGMATVRSSFISCICLRLACASLGEDMAARQA